MSNISVCVIGCEGNMGRRYMAILRTLGVEHEGYDLGKNMKIGPTQFTHFIIATPTDTHAEILEWLMTERPGRHRILVEKPVCKDPKQVEKLADMADKGGHYVYMVNQYAFRWHSGRGSGGGATLPKSSLTEYDYYQSGKDGLAWDCIQLLHMAEGEIRLANNSPVRKCTINGRIYDSAITDLLYVRMIRNFLANRKRYLWPIGELVLAHQVAAIYSDWDTNEECIDRSAGEIRIHKTEKQMLDVNRRGYPCRAGDDSGHPGG
jgi:hypothetical protein